MYQPAPAVSHGLLSGDAGLGVPRAPSALGGMQPGADLFGGQLGPPPSQSPAGSLSSTPRPTGLVGPAPDAQAGGLLGGQGSMGLGGLGGQGPLGQGGPPMMPAGSAGLGGGAPGGLQPPPGGPTWSSLDGIHRGFGAPGEQVGLGPGGGAAPFPGGNPALARSNTFSLGQGSMGAGGLDAPINRVQSVPPLGQQPQQASGRLGARVVGDIGRGRRCETHAAAPGRGRRCRLGLRPLAGPGTLHWEGKRRTPLLPAAPAHTVLPPRPPGCHRPACKAPSRATPCSPTHRMAWACSSSALQACTVSCQGA